MPLRKWTAVLAMSGLLVLAGCKKKPKTVPPPQAQAPTIQTPAPTQPAPEQPAQPAAPAPTTNESTTTPSTSTANTNANKPHRPRPTRTVTSEKDKDTAQGQKAPQQIAKATPPPSPAVAPPAIVTPSLPPDQVLHTRGTTEQLLQSTEINLSSIKRTLSTDERDMVQQAHVYVTQSRSATQDGDAARAYNLAMKAHLLSDELIKR